MNQVMDVLMKRKSVRAYENREISAEVRAEILKATLRAHRGEFDAVFHFGCDPKVAERSSLKTGTSGEVLAWLREDI